MEQERQTSSGVQLAEIVAAIALAAHLGMGQPLDHVLRSCLIATRFADRLGISADDRSATYCRRQPRPSSTSGTTRSAADGCGRAGGGRTISGPSPERRAASSNTPVS
jgi:hypothetical protein